MKTWVVKIGTSILRGTNEKSTEEVIESLCKSLADFTLKGNKVILVTSGAVG
jgi:glutamate 5-kinase